MRKLVYLISPSKIHDNFYDDLRKVLAVKNTKFFQLRLKKIKKDKIIKIANKIRKITKKYKIKLIINDNANIAKIVNADGCHLGQKELKLIKKVDEVEVKERKKPKYTPLSKRQDRPDAILWLCKNAPELTDGQISKLVGSTKNTVSLIRKRSYWNFSNLKPRDPVILALCTQESFQKSLEKAKRRVEREKKAKIREEKKAQAASV